MKKNSIITIVIVIVIVIVTAGGSFYGGTLYGKSQSKPGNFRGLNGQMPNGNFRGTTDSKIQNLINGEILSLDDKSITVKIPNNGSKIIFYSQATTVSKTVDGAVSDLKVGDNIMVNGDSNTDGSVTAKTIQIRPQFPTNQPPADQPTNPTITPPSNQ